jgi:hypothetical protein
MSKIRMLVVLTFVFGLAFGATALAEEAPKGDAPAADEKKPEAKKAAKAKEPKKAQKAEEGEAPEPEQK